MKQISRINQNGRQKLTLTTDDTGEKIFCELYYMPTQRMWCIDVDYNDFTVNGVALLNSPNILAAWKNILPFGIGITTTDGFDPYYVQDFQTGRAQFYLLDGSDLAELEGLMNEV